MEGKMDFQIKYDQLPAADKALLEAATLSGLHFAVYSQHSGIMAVGSSHKLPRMSHQEVWVYDQEKNSWSDKL
jgi:hypothetical protein